LGDIDGLVASMRELGQLQPIVLTSDMRLIAGERRLTAAKKLGWSEIEAFVAVGINDAALQLKAERDENTCRKSFTPSEEYTLYRALLDLSGASNPGASPSTRVRQEIAAIVSGSESRHRTLDKIGELIEISQDPTTTDRVRQVAQDAIREIDLTGKVTTPYRRTQIHLRAARDSAAGESDWTDAERRLRDKVLAGQTVVISLRGQYGHLHQWAISKGLLEVIDRTTEWGNPFELPGDGSRQEVIEHFRDHYLPFKPSLLSRLPELRGKVLACWCAPETCHGDVLAAEATALSADEDE
jgi:hypothetical protein